MLQRCDGYFKPLLYSFFIYLDNLVHHNRDEEIEEDGGDVFKTGLVEGHVRAMSGRHLHRNADIVLEGNKCSGQRARHLEHESHHKDHGDAGHNVGMVLDDELVREDGGVLGRGTTLHHHLEERERDWIF